MQKHTTLFMYISFLIFFFPVAAELCGGESSVVFPQSGSLDLTFDMDGKVTTDFSKTDNDGSSVTIQSDGKIIVVGKTYNGSDFDFAIVRYNIDGSLDNTFDTDGKVTTAFGPNNSYGYDVAIQFDGKIIVAGTTTGNDNLKDIALIRYNTNGSLDTSFDTDGKVTTDFGTNGTIGRSVAIQFDGKIIVVGSTYNGSDYDLITARFNSDGSLDGSFNGGGIFSTSIGSTDDHGKSVALQPNGKIIVAGYSHNGSNNDIAVVRYNNTILTLDVTIKTFLEGPFNSSISYMTATLTVPFDSPYDIAPETVNPIPPSVVDWVLVELRNKNDESEIYQSRSAFVLKLGNIVDTDGSSPVSFKLPPDDYFIVVKHRNHLGIMSNAAVTFTN